MERRLCHDNKVTNSENNSCNEAGNHVISGFIISRVILDRLPKWRFEEIDDLLAFISIYDDHRRTRAFRGLLRSHVHRIRGAVCVEGGCGLGTLSVELAKLGARKVCAVEQNPLLARLVQKRIALLPNELSRGIEVVELPLERFHSSGHINVLLHELYGQLLYDEDLWVLKHLKFKPDAIIPDGGELRAGVGSSLAYRDRVVTQDALRQLDGILVSGLHEERVSEHLRPVLRWDAVGGY